MNPWQLPSALLWRQVEQVEVLAVPCSGYTMQVISGSAPMVQRRGAEAGGLSLRSEAALRNNGEPPDLR